MGSPLPVSNKFHTCSLRSVFVHVHAAAKNDFNFIRRIRGELCEAFFDSLRIWRAYRSPYSLCMTPGLLPPSLQTERNEDSL